MSFAKYFEDNMEIIEDRQRMREEDSIYHTGIVLTVNTTVPYLNLTTKVTVEKIVPPKKQKRKTKVISCVTCAKTFKFTGGEQKFYEEHKFCDPTHCPECRAIKKQIFKNKEVC